MPASALRGSHVSSPSLRQHNDRKAAVDDRARNEIAYELQISSKPLGYLAASPSVMFHGQNDFDIWVLRSLERLASNIPTEMPPQNLGRIAVDRAYALIQIKEIQKLTPTLCQGYGKSAALAQFTAAHARIDADQGQPG